MNLCIRLAEPDEYAAAGELTAAIYVGDGFVPANDPYVDELRDAERRAKEADLLVAVDGDDVLGTVTFCLVGTPYAEISQPDEAEFRQLAVAHAGRGRGIGTALVNACIGRAPEPGEEFWAFGLNLTAN